jgi:hypothetical protein
MCHIIRFVVKPLLQIFEINNIMLNLKTCKSIITKFSNLTSQERKLYFTTSSALLQMPHHPLYPKVDWDQVASGKYAVVVSDFPGIVMYYTQKEFNLLIITWKQKDSSVQILATPNSTPESK